MREEPDVLLHDGWFGTIECFLTSGCTNLSNRSVDSALCSSSKGVSQTMINLRNNKIHHRSQKTRRLAHLISTVASWVATIIAAIDLTTEQSAARIIATIAMFIASVFLTYEYIKKMRSRQRENRKE